MEGMKDWNEMNIEEYITHLENKFLVDSSGTAKAVFELIRAYRILTTPIIKNCCPECDSTEWEQYSKSDNQCLKCGRIYSLYND